jgi:predicted cobalt transporter CbtA
MSDSEKTENQEQKLLDWGWAIFVILCFATFLFLPNITSIGRQEFQVGALIFIIGFGLGLFACTFRMKLWATLLVVAAFICFVGFVTVCDSLELLTFLRPD